MTTDKQSDKYEIYNTANVLAIYAICFFLYFTYLWISSTI